MEIFIAAHRTDDFNLSLAIQIVLLHDTLEDTDTSFDELLNSFGKEVADGVLALTKNDNLPKELRMADSLARIRNQPKEVWAVKIADRITNLQHPPNHWSKDKILQYLEEAKIIHRELMDGNRYLADRLLLKIEEYGSFV
jgi:guanosine-3',5'-bis(diphosphate) 3'-pyrophosphohydrolase